MTDYLSPAEMSAALARAERMLIQAREQYARDTVLIAALQQFIIDRAGRLYTLNDCDDLLHPVRQRA